MRSPLLRLLLCQWSSVALSASANIIHHRRLESLASSNSTANSTISHSSSSSSTLSTSSLSSSLSTSSSSQSSSTDDIDGPTGGFAPQLGTLTSTTTTGADVITPIPLGTVTSTTTSTAAAAVQFAGINDTPSPLQISAVHIGAGSSSTNWNATNPFPSSTTADVGGLLGTAAATPLIASATPPFPLGNATLPPFPMGNGTAAGSAGATGTGRPADTCGGCTVNVRGASVDYWFPATYSYATGTLSTVTVGTTSYYSLFTITSPYNVTQTMLEGAITTTVSYFSDWDFYVTLMDSYTITPSAVSTVEVPRSSVLPVTGLVGLDDFDALSIDPGAATVDIPLPSGTVSVATSTTPFVYFSVYEVERLAKVTQTGGQVVCSTATTTFNLSQPFAFDYVGDTLEQASTAQGDIPSAFLQQIPQSSCAAGRYLGEVTVLVVVDIGYDIEFNAEPFVEHVESSATSGFAQESFQPEDGHLSSSTEAAGAQSTGSGGGGLGSIIVSILGLGGANTGGGGGGSNPTGGESFSPELGHLSTSQGSPATPLPDLSQTTSSSPIIVGSQTASAGSSSQVIIGSQTLTPGGPPITVGSTVVSLAPSGTAIVVGGTTSKVAQTTPGGVIVGSHSTGAPVPVLTIGSSTITGNAATQFSFGPGSTLTPGGTVVVSGTTVSLDPSASFVVIGGSTQVLPTAAPTGPNGGVFTVGDSTVTGNAGSTFVVQGQTLSPGGSPITINGPGGPTTISLAAGGSSVVVNGATEVITPVITPAPLTLGGTVFSVTDGSTFVVGGQTLAPGDVITFTDGQGHATTVSLGPSASFVVVNGQTSFLEGPITDAPLLTIGGIIYTALPGGTTYIIDGQTLTPGGDIVVSGTTISLDPYATALVINGQTETLFPATTTSDGSTTTTDAPGSGITSNTPINTGAAATTTKKKGAAGSLRAANRGEFLTIGVTAFFGAFLVAVAVWL